MRREWRCAMNKLEYVVMSVEILYIHHWPLILDGCCTEKVVMRTLLVNELVRKG